METWSLEPEFRAALSAAGLDTSAPIIPDGELHRFKANGDRSENGWYVLHADDPPAGAFGCWKRGISESWCSKPTDALSLQERAITQRRWQEDKAKRDAAQAARSKTAMTAASKIWDVSPPAPSDHPYLVRKGVKVPELRITGDALLVPLRDTAGILCSLQFIAPNGDKRFLKDGRKRGAFFTLGTLENADQAYICEGVATAASVHAASGIPVIAAMDTSNLAPVALAVREAYPDMTLIFAADHDDHEKGNVGMAKAVAAARRVRGLLVQPTTPGTDFNDLHLAEGLEAVRERLATAALSPDLAESTHRPVTLRIHPGELAELADKAELALHEHLGKVYQRGGQLVRIGISQAETVQGIHRQTGTPMIAPIDADYLVDQFNRLITWEKFNERLHDWVVCNAPRPVASALLSRSGEWKLFRPLVTFITAPTLRPDGSLLDKPGYDVETGLLFVDMGTRFPNIPSKPDQAAGRAALAYLFDSVLAEFQFGKPHHRAAALSAILTALVRYALPTAPMHAITAPRPGSGKSLLADVVGLIANGTGATALSYASEPDELRKRLFSALVAGDSVVNLDNVEEPLQGSALCSILTGETFTDRVMGASRIQTVPTICTWLATGNNLAFKGDITRRVLLCEIDPECERPEDRHFKRDLRKWIPANRPALVAAGLTAIRAYVAAGKPPQVDPMGSFEEWSSLVRSTLVWLGETDPLLGRAEVESVDPIRTKLRAIVLAWYCTFKTAPATAGEAVYRANDSYLDDQGKEVYTAPALREVIHQHFTNNRGEPCSHVLGAFLSAAVKRVECGARLEADGKSQRATRWRLQIKDRKTLETALNDFLLN